MWKVYGSKYAFTCTTRNSQIERVRVLLHGHGTPWHKVIEIQDSLSEYRKKLPHGKASLSFTCRMAEQMVISLEELHDIGILHRDVKPGNFCLAHPSENQENQGNLIVSELDRKLYLIDYGLSRRYLTSSGGIREARDKVGFRGTARYASISAHTGKELGRVDDLWSVLYIMVEFLTGTLPWKGKEKDVIGELKQKHTNPNLVSGLPPQLLQILNYLSSLEYASRPNYLLLIEWIKQMTAEDLTDECESRSPILPEEEYHAKDSISSVTEVENVENVKVFDEIPLPKSSSLDPLDKTQNYSLDVLESDRGITVHPPLFYFHQQLAKSVHDLDQATLPVQTNSNEITQLAQYMKAFTITPQEKMLPRPPSTPAPFNNPGRQSRLRKFF